MYGRGALWRFPAPANAAGLDILVGGKAVSVAVADGVAELPETETRTIPAGNAVSQWRLDEGLRGL